MPATTQPRIITTQQLYHAFVEAGVIREDENIRRMVIDIDPDRGYVVMYVERYGDERLLKVAQTLEGIEISQVPAGPASEEDDA